MTDAGAAFPNVRVSGHPLVRHKMRRLADERTDAKQFRELARELTALLLSEATVDLPVRPVRFRTRQARCRRPPRGCRRGAPPS